MGIDAYTRAGVLCLSHVISFASAYFKEILRQFGKHSRSELVLVSDLRVAL